MEGARTTWNIKTGVEAPKGFFKDSKSFVKVGRKESEYPVYMWVMPYSCLTSIWLWF